MMDLMKQVQFLNEAIYLSLYANDLGKGMNPFLSPNNYE